MRDVAQRRTPENLDVIHVALPRLECSPGGFVRLNMVSSADGAPRWRARRGAWASDPKVSLRRASRRRRRLAGGYRHRRSRAASELSSQIWACSRSPSSPTSPATRSCARLVAPRSSSPTTRPRHPMACQSSGEESTAEWTCRALIAHVGGQVVLPEGGPALAGAMFALGLVDEFFHTVAPRCSADPISRQPRPVDDASWGLTHGFVDSDGYLCLRYSRPENTNPPPRFRTTPEELMPPTRARRDHEDTWRARAGRPSISAPGVALAPMVHSRRSP